jgi:hypothetical protein
LPRTALMDRQKAERVWAGVREGWKMKPGSSSKKT